MAVSAITAPVNLICRLNTLSGGHPLGGAPRPGRTGPAASLNTLSGGHPLGGKVRDVQYTDGKMSQYPLRRASSWRSSASFRGIRPSRSQYPLRRASSWRRRKDLHRRRVSSLNTLSGGHPLGGLGFSFFQHAAEESQYPLRRASSWRVGIPHLARKCRESQYPLRRASSWRDPRRSRRRPPHWSQYPLRRASSWRNLDCRRRIACISSQYPLRRASSWRRSLRLVVPDRL